MLRSLFVWIKLREEIGEEEVATTREAMARDGLEDRQDPPL
jgi:hypothetical protein